MASNSSNQQRVLIIGAGVTGLLIAQGLRKIGIACTIFERDTSLDARGGRDWNFIVHWGRSAFQTVLPDDLTLETIRKEAATDEHIPNGEEVLPGYNLVTGELLHNIPTPFSMRLQKQKLRHVLSREVDIRFGKRLVNIQTDRGRVTAAFEDGSTEEGQLLIGADGARSKVREYLLGPEKAAVTPLRMMASRVITTLPTKVALRLHDLHPRNVVAYSPKGIVFWASAQDRRSTDPSNWTFVIAQSWIIPESVSSEETRIDSSKYDIVRAMKERAQSFGQPFKMMCESIPDDAEAASRNQLSSWITEKWDNQDGTVTLAGDAAHAMTFHRGQGLNNAVQDAATLISALQQHSTSNGFRDVLSVYEPEVWTRGREAVISSNENSESVMNWDRLTQSPLFRIGMARDSAA